MLQFGRNILVVFVFLSFFASCTQQKESNLQYVDPTIGGVGVILEPRAPRHTFPTVL